MKAKTLALAVALLSVSLSATADPIGYPGSTWGVLTGPTSAVNGTPEDDNIIYQGKITQGIDWFKFGVDKQWVFDTYGSLGFTFDRNGLDYNNKVVPGIGLKAVRHFDKGVIDFGVEGIYEQHVGSHRGATSNSDYSGYGVQFYVSYWFGWNLGK